MTLTAAAVPRTSSTTALADIDPHLAQHIECELGLSKRNATTPGSGTRKNAWGNLSYAELISKAILTSAEQRLTLAEIYDWMIKYVPFFRNKIDRVSSAGWKVSEVQRRASSFALSALSLSRIPFVITCPCTIVSNVYKVKALANHRGG